MVPLTPAGLDTHAGSCGESRVVGWPLRWLPWGEKGTFYGGVFLPVEKERTEDRPIELLPIPKRLYVPLIQDCGRAAEACVEAGQAVRCGELIGRASGPDCAAVHASADGVVRAITTCDTAHDPEVPCVEIETARAAVPHVTSARTASTIEELIGHVSAAGIVEHDSLGGGGVPTAARLGDAAARGCECLIVNAMESEPCVTADWRVLVERTDDILAGARRLADLLHVRNVWLAVDESKRRMVAQLVARTHGSAMHVAPLINKYPQGHPALLVKAIRKREIPYGKSDLDVGAMVIGVGTIAAIESLLRSGMPMTQRLVTVAGGAVGRAGNYMIAVGTPVADVIEHVGLRRSPWAVLLGSPMTGVSIRRLETVVTKRTTAILLFSDEDTGGPSRGTPMVSPGACTRCGWCLEDCPVGLDPAALLNAAERRLLDRASALRVRACIGCGLCSYACPARLPIAESIRALQRAVRGGTAGSGLRVSGSGAQEPGKGVSQSGGKGGLPDRALADKPPVAPECAPQIGSVGTAHPAPMPLPSGMPPAREGSEGGQDARPPIGSVRTAHPTVLPRLLRAEPPPYWHGFETTASATWTWVAAASLPAIAGVMLFGTGALSVLAVSIATALLAEKVLSVIISRPASDSTVSGRAEAQALLTGLLVALTLPSNALAVGWYVPVTAALIATLIGQTLLGGHGNHLWHPAAMARVTVELLFGARFAQVLAAHQPAGETGVPFTSVNALVALAMGDPRFVEAGRSPITVAIRDYLPQWGLTLFGSGGIGPTGATITGPSMPIGGHIVMLIVAALILGWRGHVRGWCVVSALTAAAFVLPIEHGGRLMWFPGRVFDEGLPVGLAYVLHHLTADGLMLVILLLASDSVTSPLTSRGQRWFGAGVGALAIALRLYGLAVTGGYWALLAMNTLVPLIDRRTKRRVYGT
jgi:electron transport complex protein RnfC